jgi:hypothetical protein
MKISIINTTPEPATHINCPLIPGNIYLLVNRRGEPYNVLVQWTRPLGDLVAYRCFVNCKSGIRLDTALDKFYKDVTNKCVLRYTP